MLAAIDPNLIGVIVVRCLRALRNLFTVPDQIELEVFGRDLAVPGIPHKYGRSMS